MTSGTGKWERVPLAQRPGHGGAAAPARYGGSDAAPLFAALAREWRSKGRVVPGARDHEWEFLMGRPAWPGR
ncbi:hypothetical protein [Streptomyces thermolilacinus]|uniref:hypothetical protein n=1 Tax=Streptomyces thermolilacinus TaxID=285540 RepID=UPI0033C9D95A